MSQSENQPKEQSPGTHRDTLDIGEFGSRVLYSARVLWKQGFAVLILFALFLAIAIASLKSAIEEYESELTQSEQDLHQLATTSVLPKRDEQLPVVAVAAARWAGVDNSVVDKMCSSDRSLRACVQRRAFAAAMRRSANLAPFDESEVESITHAAVQAMRDGNSGEATSPRLDNESSGFHRSLILAECRTGSSLSAQAHTRSYGRAVCEYPSDTTSTLFVAPSRISRCSASSTAPTDTCLTERTLEFAKESRILDALAPALAAAPHRNDANTAPRDATESQAYFISVDGAIRIWSDRADETFAVRATMRLWNEAYYVEQALFGTDHDGYLITPAYLDATGNGFVQTECFDVRDESSRLLGVACIDTSVPSNALELSSTQKPLPLFIGSELQVSARGSQLQIGSGEVDRRLLDRAGIETEEEWRATASSLLRAKLTSAESHSLPFDRVQVLRFPNGAEIFAVPLALISRPEEAFTWRVLFFVFNPTTARYWPMAVAFIVLVIGMVAGLVVALWRYARERTQREDAILRNLRVGVIQSDANYYILRGNDRAEEILRCKIATFGADSHYAVDPPNLLSIIEHTVLVPPNDYPDSTWSLAQLSDIAKLRLRGLSSRYYARLVRPDSLQRRAGEWIEIQGTPFFDPTPAGQRQVETFGVINSLPFPLRRFLSVIERQLRERATK
jgi:hypothetical protein